MNKKQRIRSDVKLAISQNPLGAGRDAAILKLRKKYGTGRLSTRAIDTVTRHVCYPEN